MVLINEDLLAIFQLLDTKLKAGGNYFTTKKIQTIEESCFLGWKTLDSQKEKWESFLDNTDTILQRRDIYVLRMMDWIVSVAIMKTYLDILEASLISGSGIITGIQI